MRKIELTKFRAFQDDPAAPPTNLEEDYGELIVMTLRQQPQGGYSVEQMILAVEIRRILKEARTAGTDHILLEEQHWHFLAARAQESRWPIADPAIPAFVQAVRSAPKVEVAETQAA